MLRHPDPWRRQEYRVSLQITLRGSEVWVSKDQSLTASTRYVNRRVESTQKQHYTITLIVGGVYRESTLTRAVPESQVVYSACRGRFPVHLTSNLCYGFIPHAPHKKMNILSQPIERSATNHCSKQYITPRCGTNSAQFAKWLFTVKKIHVNSAKKRRWNRVGSESRIERYLCEL